MGVVWIVGVLGFMTGTVMPLVGRRCRKVAPAVGFEDGFIEIVELLAQVADTLLEWGFRKGGEGNGAKEENRNHGILGTHGN